MTNKSITLRLSPYDLSLIDKKIMEGYFTSRSDAIRHSIRYLLHQFESKENNINILGDIAKDNNLKMTDIRKALKKVHKDSYREVYGND